MATSRTRRARWQTQHRLGRTRRAGGNSQKQEEDSYPRALLRAAQHVEEFVAGFGRTVHGCLFGDLILKSDANETPQASPQAGILTPFVFLWISFTALCAVIALLLGRFVGREPAWFMTFNSWTFYLFACLCAVGSTVFLALLRVARRVDRLSYSIIVTAIGLFTMKDTLRTHIGESWQQWYWIGSCVLMLAAVSFTDKPLALRPPDPTNDELIHVVVERYFKRDRSQKPDLRAVIRSGALRLKAGAARLLWTTRGWLSLLGLGAAMLVVVGSVGFTQLASEHATGATGSSRPVTVAEIVFAVGTIAFVGGLTAETAFRNARGMSQALGRAAYQVGVSSVLAVATLPLFFLAFLIGSKSSGLTIGLFVLAVFVQWISSRAWGRLRSSTGYECIVLLANIGVVSVGLAIFEAWSILGRANAEPQTYRGWLRLEQQELQFVHCNSATDTRVVLSGEPAGWGGVSTSLRYLAKLDPAVTKSIALPVTVVGAMTPSGMVVTKMREMKEGDPCAKKSETVGGSVDSAQPSVVASSQANRGAP